ncbi:MAG: AI-2E family transporter [Methanosarcinales archaeon]
MIDGVSTIIKYKWKIATLLGVVVLFIIVAWIFSPLLDGIILGLVFAYVARPINYDLGKYLKYPKIVSLIATLCIITPIALILSLGAMQIIDIINNIITGPHSDIQSTILDLVTKMDIPEPIYNKITEELSTIMDNLMASIISIASQINYPAIAKELALIFINLIISLFVCYYLLLDGEKLVESVVALVPQENIPIVREYIDSLDKTLSGIFIGNVYTAIIVSVISVFVFYFFKIPYILALASFIFLAALVPILAGWMVLVPVSIYKYLDQGLESAIIFFVVSSIVIYGPPELILRPYIVSVKSDTHPLLMMLAFIGGAFMAGLSGFFVAPILVGALIAAHKVYVNNKKESLEDISEVEKI